MREEPKKLYACNICCTKLAELNAPCKRCNQGIGEQVYPVVQKPCTEKIREVNLARSFYNGIPRLQKRPRVVCAEMSENARAFGTSRVTQKYPKRRVNQYQ